MSIGPMLPPFASTVERLQYTCADVYEQVLAVVEAGQSELDVANLINDLFAERDVTSHWYDVPHIVLIGAERFVEGTTTTAYGRKAPQKDVLLKRGDPVHVDFSPMDSSTDIWGDWSATFVFGPDGSSLDEQKIRMLREVRQIQLDGISHVNATATGSEIAEYYLDAFRSIDVTLLDVRNNVGHSIHSGSKSKANRVWLDAQNDTPIGEGVFTIEPGGIRRLPDQDVVGRFEVCIYVPLDGPATVLGGVPEIPLATT